MRRIHNTSTVFIFLICILQVCLPTDAYAFKLNTHVWIAQQVINDLENDPEGQLEIPINGTLQKFKVDPAIRAAILENPKMYLMGNIGPDASPDVIIGQFSIHPGPTLHSDGKQDQNPGGFGTDEWAIALEEYVKDIKNRSTVEDIYKNKKAVCEQKTYNLDKVWDVINGASILSGGNPWGSLTNKNALLDALADSVTDNSFPQVSTQTAINPAELAYQKGFLGHMAADTFAHTYVNHYTGDIFWLTDGEIEVEKRHAAIESFIDQRLPPLTQGKPYELAPTNEQIPAEFLAEAFIFNNKLKNQYKNYDVTKYAYVLSRYRAAIRSAATDCSWTGISRFASQAIIYSITNGIYVPNEKQVTAINQLLDKANSAGGKVLANSQAIKDEIDKSVLAQHKKNFDKILSATNEVTNTLDKLIALDQDAKAKAEKVQSLILNKQCNLEGDITEKVCSNWKTALFFPPICLLYKLHVITPGCLKYAAYNDAVALRKKADDALIAAVRDNDTQFKAKLTKLRDTMSSAMTTTNLAVSAINELKLISSNSIDPFQSILTEWDKNITVATVEWVRANAQVQINSMNLVEIDPNDSCWKFGLGISECVYKDNNGLKPLTDWSKNYAPGLLGVPTGLTKFLESANQTITETSEFLKIIAPLDPITRQLKREIEKYVSLELSGTNVPEELLKLTGDKALVQLYRDINAIFYIKWSDAAIDAQFASNGTGKWLPDYPIDPTVQYNPNAFSLVLHRETGSVGTAPVDLNKFNTLTNATTLAKLSLLNATQLNILVSNLGIRTPTYNYGPVLYQDNKEQVIADEILRIKAECHGLTAALCRAKAPAQVRSRSDSLPTPWGGYNILYGAIKSIDGSEQWKPVSGDSNLNRVTNAYTEKAAQKFYANMYGYDLDDSSANSERYGKMFNKGFRIWQEAPATEKSVYFNQLFKMPLYECGTNANKIFITDVPGQDMGTAMTNAAKFCGNCKPVGTRNQKNLFDIVCDE